MKNDYKISHELAEEAFDEMCSAVDINCDEDYMDADGAKVFEDAKRKVIKAIRTNRLVIKEDGMPVYTDRKGESHEFKEPLGGVFLSPQKKNEPQMKQMYSVATELTGGSAIPGKMHMADVRVILAIATLFISI